MTNHTIHTSYNQVTIVNQCNMSVVSSKSFSQLVTQSIRHTVTSWSCDELTGSRPRSIFISVQMQSSCCLQRWVRHSGGDYSASNHGTQSVAGYFGSAKWRFAARYQLQICLPRRSDV